ncbi:MAG: sugar transferase [Gemmobacter sp.]|nr:sugar transferase [Gemmobacter sp.]
MTAQFTQFIHDADLSQHVDAASQHDTTYRDNGVYRRGFKRALDMSLVLLAAPFVLPLVAGLAIAVARSGGRPFYTQDRVGKGGRVFRMWKLRSMVVDADARMEDHLASDPEARREWDETQKLRNDPRITSFGQFLRKSSLDELPQLWNVFLGDMSLVGPRPMMTCQTSLYPSTAYYAVRPGITGYWQTAGRGKTTFAARAQYDNAYEQDLSLSTDIAVLARTVSVVLNGTGS